jgi:hypothetical protein
LRLNRRSAFSSGSPSCSLTSANVVFPLASSLHHAAPMVQDDHLFYFQTQSDLPPARMLRIQGLVAKKRGGY